MDTVVDCFNSSFNFILSNKVFSMESNTAMILPPVLFKIVSDDDKYSASSIFTLLEKRSKTVSTDRPYFISSDIFVNSKPIGPVNLLLAISIACMVDFPDLKALFIIIIAFNMSCSIFLRLSFCSTIKNKSSEKKTKAKLFVAALNDKNGEKIKPSCADEAYAVADLMRKCDYHVDDVKKSVSFSKPAPPFTTSTMQQEASHKLNMTAERTSRVAQQLYEGVNIEGEGQHALITYIRTDSVRISPDFAKIALSFIAKNYGSEYAPKTQNIYKTSDNAQDAHEAIRPIDLNRTPKSLEGKMDRDAYRLYKLVYERFMASQMTPAQYNTMRVHILGESGDEKLGFVVKGKSVKFKGFTAVYSATVEENDEDKELDTMPDLNEGEHLNLDDVGCEQKFTKPPARYNDATLVKALEENGIGRPSTYASIISVIAKREYTEKQQKSIVPTQLGEAVCEYMEKNFPDIMNLNFTARLEGALDKVADGKQQWQELIGAFYPRLMKFVERAAKQGGGNYLPDEESDVVCDKCGAKMVVRHGKYGPFLACPNYPKCKNIKRIVEVVGKCPKCGGDVSKLVSKAGKTFYGCTNYPKCDFISWDVPAPYFCPDCGSTMKVVKRDDKTYYVCTNHGCKHKELVKEEE